MWQLLNEEPGNVPSYNKKKLNQRQKQVQSQIRKR